MTNHTGSVGTKTINDSKTDESIEEPKKYKVIFHNDDFTPMDFVVFLLKSVFHYDEATANNKMMEVHSKDKAIVGVYTREIAETKVSTVLKTSQKYEFPFQATMEPE